MLYYNPTIGGYYEIGRCERISQKNQQTNDHKPI